MDNPKTRYEAAAATLKAAVETAVVALIEAVDAAQKQAVVDSANAGDPPRCVPSGAYEEAQRANAPLKKAKAVAALMAAVEAAVQAATTQAT